MWAAPQYTFLMGKICFFPGINFCKMRSQLHDDAEMEVLEFCEILLFCFWDLEDQSLTDIVSYIIFCLEIFPEMSYYLYSTTFSQTQL